MIEIYYSDFKELSKSPLHINNIKFENLYSNYSLSIGLHSSNPSIQFIIDKLCPSVYLNRFYIRIIYSTSYMKKARFVDKTNSWISCNRLKFRERTD